MPVASRRIAIIATPSVTPRPGPSNLDGDVLRARLPQLDAGFSVFDLDPLVDLAEQVDRIFDEHPVGRRDAVLFYAAAPLVLSVEGDLFLCLDPAHPTVGDALADLAQVFRERARCPLLFVVDGRFEDDGGGVVRAAEIVEAARRAVASAGGPIELLVSAAPMETRRSVPGPFTTSIVRLLDNAEPATGLTADALYSALRRSADIVGAVPAFGRATTEGGFVLIPAREPGATPAAPARVSEPAPREVVPTPEAPPRAPEPLPEAPARAAEATPREAAPSVPQPPTVPRIIPAAPPVPMAPPPGAAPRSEASPATAKMSGSAPVPAAPRRVQAMDDGPRVIIADPRDRPSAQPPKAAEPALVAEVAKAPEPVAVAAPAAAAPAALVVAPPTSIKEEAPKPTSTRVAKPTTVEDFLAEGDAHARAGEDEAALNSYKKCLGLVARGANSERAEIYVRIAGIKRRQDKAREAISNYEKALGVVAEHRGALEALVDLYAAVADTRATFAAEEKLLALLGDREETFARLVAFGARWMDEAKDPVRARMMLDKARALRGDDLGVLDRLRALYEADGDTERAFALRREMVGLLPEARAKASALFGMARDLLGDPTKEDRALALCDEALETDPSFLSPLEVVAKVLAERQEWSELEQAYRRMLERAPRLADGEVRGRVRAELHRMLGLLFREHLVDPASALDAYEQALVEQPDDLAGQLVAAELALEIDAPERAEAHLLAATTLEPKRAATYHDLFRVRTGAGHDEAAYLAASVTVFLGEPTPGEKAIYDAHRPKGMLSPKSHLPDGAWALLRGPGARVVSGVLEPIADAAVSARLGELEARSRLPKLDPAARQDPEKSTISVVRSLSWASHLLGVPAPAVYLSDDPAVALSAVPAREPSALAGGAVLRGRSPNELAFLVGKHLAYYVGSHRLLIHYPSIEELSVCFLAAVSVIRPDSPVPPRFADAVAPLVRRLHDGLTPAARADLAEGLEVLDAAGGKANLGGWVAAVERSAARAGYLLSGDLSVAATALRADPVGLLSADDKIADLCSFTVTPEYAALREALGIGDAA